MKFPTFLHRAVGALLALALFASPAHATNDKPLVIIGGQTRQLPSTDGLQLNAGSTSAPSLNIPCALGAAPTSPSDGDAWCTTAGLFIRIGSVTVGPLGTVGGLQSVAANSVLGNFTGSSAAPGATALTDCHGTNQFVQYTAGGAGSAWGCATASGGSGGVGNVSTTGSPASGNLAKFTGANTISNGDLSGDCTTSGTLVVTCSGKFGGTTVIGTGGDIYVNGSTGSDSNNCTASGTACLTFAHAHSLIPSLIGGAYTIHIADATYAECLSVFGHNAQYGNWTPLTITGNDTTPTNVLFTGKCSSVACATCGAQIADGIAVNIDGIAVEPSSASTWGIFVAHTPFTQLKAVTIAGSITNGLGIQFGALLSVQGNITITNWTGQGIFTSTGASFGNNASMTLVLTPNASGGSNCIFANSNSTVDMELGGTITCPGGSNPVTAVLDADSNASIFNTVPITAVNPSTPGGSSPFYAEHGGLTQMSGTITATKWTAQCAVSFNGMVDQTGTRTFTTVGASSILTGGQCSLH
jgi:hypothetical protein